MHCQLYRIISYCFPNAQFIGLSPLMYHMYTTIMHYLRPCANANTAYQMDGM